VSHARITRDEALTLLVGAIEASLRRGDLEADMGAVVDVDHVEELAGLVLSRNPQDQREDA
jgi:hypothetical protein